MKPANTTLGAIRDPRDLVEEYLEKLAKIPDTIKAYEEAGEKINQVCTVSGAFGRRDIFDRQGRVSKETMEKALLGSAWWAAFKWCNMNILATAADKKKFDQDMQNPPPFTVENLVGTFGPYLADPREAILRGLAEAFITLDPAYKSHSKVKVGVKGLPKRVIINNARSEWSRLGGWGWQRAEDMLNALQVFDGDGLVDRDILYSIQRGDRETYRGLTFKFFKNGNLHVHFSEHACLQINRGLAEYYGDVLPDVEPDKDDLKADPRARDLAKDLQYYPTPVKVAREVLTESRIYGVQKVLDPQCGCGRLLDAVAYREKERAKGWSRTEHKKISLHAIEYHAGRVREARAKGYTVMQANFLEVEHNHLKPYDLVFMNPPFYGRHYLKHVIHALKFVKPGGKLISILPATAHYDHQELPGDYSWHDLPVGSFSESGTRVPTGYAIWLV